jgi:hypothetical protein
VSTKAIRGPGSAGATTTIETGIATVNTIMTATMTATTTGVTVATVAAAPAVADIPPAAVAARPAVAAQPAVASARRDSDTFAALPTLGKPGKTSLKKNARQS